MRASLLSVMTAALLSSQTLVPVAARAADPLLSLEGTIPVGGMPDAIVAPANATSPPPSPPAAPAPGRDSISMLRSRCISPAR